MTATASPETKPAKPDASAWMTYALVGNPNSGKTTVFNALTGLRQKVGNYPGVTVERVEGSCFSQHGKRMQIIDLPGSYSLSARSPDEAIMQEVLLGRRPETPAPDRIVCILDASNLERNLFLATHVIELGKPVILVLNMMDQAIDEGLKIDAERLGQILGVTVVCTRAQKGQGIVDLKLAMSRADLKPSTWRSATPDLFKRALAEVAEGLQASGSFSAFQAQAEAALLLTNGIGQEVPGAIADDPEAVTLARKWQRQLDAEAPGWQSQLVARRYEMIADICRQVVVYDDRPRKASLTERLDRVFLHPIGGILSFAGIMSLLFFSIFKLAEPFMGMIEEVFAFLQTWVNTGMPEGDLQSLISDGIIGGVGGVLVFLPQILILFFFISLLESSGYMARAAFMLDRVMGKVGLHGRSFVPLLSSYACAVPGIMAARTIDSPKDRLVTILVAPFMTCAARLPVYLVMIATLFPAGDGSAMARAGFMVGLYFLGTAGAFLFAFIFKGTLLKGGGSKIVMELPPYRVPTVRHVLTEMWDRARIFVKRAGTIILGISIILWFLLAYPKAEPGMTDSEQLANSFGGRIGKTFEPVFEPLGFDWKMNIGVVASFAAREVFVSTMTIIYSIEAETEEEQQQKLIERLQNERDADGNPVFSPLTCMSLMVFYVFALQCISTIAVVKRETNSWRWPMFQLGYMTAVAYLASLAVYQGGLLLGFQ